jgi:hypothetical protein
MALPSISQLGAYGSKTAALAVDLNDETTRPEAIDVVRSFVSEVQLHPDKETASDPTIESF